MGINKIGIIGLGYVGLPLAIEFSKKNKVVGFDIDKIRVSELSKIIDITNEANLEDLREAVKGNSNQRNVGLFFSSNISDLKGCNIYIVTVPTPINKFKSPDLEPLLMASEMLGGVIKKGDIVIYESTVYPGCTEEDCVPVLEKFSGLIILKPLFFIYFFEKPAPAPTSKPSSFSVINFFIQENLLLRRKSKFLFLLRLKSSIAFFISATTFIRLLSGLNEIAFFNLIIF